MTEFPVYSVAYDVAGTDIEVFTFDRRRVGRAPVHSHERRTARRSPERRLGAPEGARLEERDGNRVLVWEYEGAELIADVVVALHWSQHQINGLSLLSAPEPQS
jgi:hypothetical protein